MNARHLKLLSAFIQFTIKMEMKDCQIAATRFSWLAIICASDKVAHQQSAQPAAALQYAEAIRVSYLQLLANDSW